MKAVEFCYWLQGFFELSEASSLNWEQTGMIKQHLDMVFIHDIDKTYPQGQQAALNAAHGGNNDPSKPVARC